MNQKKIKVQIWSDVVCPFCYIGKRHFEKALSQFEHANEVVVEWRSFQLDPELKPTGEGLYEYLAARKGMSLLQSRGLHDQVTQMAARAGLIYNFDKAVLANTFSAHRVIQLAKEKDLGNEMEERLFAAYFSEGKDIQDQATLVELGKEIGLAEEDVKTSLSDSVYSDKVNNDLAMARKLNIHGVPFFVFNNTYAVSGAQPPESFLEVLRKTFA